MVPIYCSLSPFGMATYIIIMFIAINSLRVFRVTYPKGISIIVCQICSHVEYSPHVKPSQRISTVHPTKLDFTSICRQQILSTDGYILCYHRWEFFQRVRYYMGFHIIASNIFTGIGAVLILWTTPCQSQRNPRTWCVGTHGKFNCFFKTFRPTTAIRWSIWIKKKAIRHFTAGEGGGGGAYCMIWHLDWDII